MLRWRLLLGVVFAAALVGLLALDHVAAVPGLWLAPLAIALGILATGETLRLLRSQRLYPPAWLIYSGTTLLVASNFLPFWTSTTLEPFAWPLSALAMVFLAVLAAEIFVYDGTGLAVERAAVGMFAVVYVGVLLTFIVQLRGIGGGRLGIAAICSLLIVVKGSDIGAYTFGRLFGRNRLAPRLSPGKTVEGLLGGYVTGCLGAWFSIRLLTSWLSDTPNVGAGAWRWLAFGVLVTTAGVLGDLAESLLKRDAHQKDSSDWMPGFGGVLDLLDSPLLAAPVAYLCWRFLIVTS